MLIKGEGIINGIVYEHTTYHSGKFRLYPTITDLDVILEEIIQSKSTTEYLRINPFYVNGKINRQIEFDEYMFYLECREQFDEEELKEHILNCLDEPVSMEQFERGKIRYPLCRYNDAENYKFAIEKYRAYLNTLLPSLLDFAKETMELKDDDLAFGYFCFEIHSE